MTITQANHYQYPPEPGFSAQQNTNYPWWIASPIASGAPIGVGIAVVHTQDGGCAVPGAPGATEKFVGVTLKSQAMENNAAGLPTYRANSATSVMVEGRMFIETNEQVSAGARVFVGEGGELTPTNTGTPLPRARYVRTAPGAGSITEIELR